MPRLAILLLVLAAAPCRAQDGAVRIEGATGLVPTDTTRWTEVETGSGVRVYLDTEMVRPVEGILEVWTWRAYSKPHRPRFGAPYDRVLARDRVFCDLGTTAPLQQVRYLGRASVDSFMFPPSVGPFAWGRAEAAVARQVCALEDASDADSLGPDLEAGYLPRPPPRRP